MYGSATAKRHVAWSNSRTVQLLDLGHMVKSKYQHKGVKSSRTYTNRQGKKDFLVQNISNQLGSLNLFDHLFFMESVLMMVLFLFFQAAI